MLTQTIARALDLEDDGVVKEPVQEGRGHDGITEELEELAPFGEAAVGGEDHGAFFVAGVDELEEQIAAAGNDRQVADFIDDEQGELAEEPDLLAQRAVAFGLGERADEVGERAEVDAATGFDRFDAERQAQVALSGAGRSSNILPGITASVSGFIIRFIRAAGTLWLLFGVSVSKAETCSSSINSMESRQQKSPVAVVVISSNGKADRPVESLDVKGAVGWETGQVRTGRRANWQAVADV